MSDPRSTVHGGTLDSPGAVGDVSPTGPRRVIRSPEQVALDLGIAGPMSRILAFSIDYGIILIADVVVLLALLFAASTLSIADPFLAELDELAIDSEDGTLRIDGIFLLLMAVLVLVDFVLQWLYFVFFELVMQGRSPGKAALALRVMRDGGLPGTMRESMLRNLLRMVDMLPSSYFVGLVSMVLSKQGKRLGDFAAGTIVVREDRPGAAPSLDSVALPEEVAVFRFDRAQLSKVGRTERRLVRQTLRRLPHLAPQQREAILARAVDVMRNRIDFEEPLDPAMREAFLHALLRAAEGRAL